MARPVILYDQDCGFCKWCLSKVLGWDRKRVLRPVALQDSEADTLLRHMPETKKMASWHLVDERGEVHSADQAFGALAALLPYASPLGMLAGALPTPASRAYDFVARNRSWFGRLTRTRVPAAERRIEARRQD